MVTSIERAKQLGAVAQRMGRGMALSRRNVFVTTAPSPQTAVDAAPDAWASRMPSPLQDVQAGDADLFDDQRIRWAFERLGDVSGANVLELGPLEGGHSYMAQQAGAERVVGVEANSKAFLKCLVAKELLGLDRCSFLCGEITEYLRSSQESFDVCLACGILYHMVNPIELLDLISQRASRLFIWTHVYSDDASKNPGLARKLGPPGQIDYNGVSYDVVRHSYSIDSRLTGFFGGVAPHSNWLTRSSLMDALRNFGWRDIETAFDEPSHQNGPALALVAIRDAAMT